MNAGSTPAFMNRPLSSGPPTIRRVPSASSMNSETSRKSGYQHYDPSTYVDAAFLSSTENLASMQSPHTMANTMANTRGNSAYSAGPSRLRPSSPSMGSYASFGN